MMKYRNDPISSSSRRDMCGFCFVIGDDQGHSIFQPGLYGVCTRRTVSDA